MMIKLIRYFKLILFMSVLLLSSCKMNYITNGSDYISNSLSTSQYLYETETPLLTDINIKTFEQWQKIVGNDLISNNCQSMAIYNDYVFNFSAFDDVYIFSLKNKDYNFHAKIPYSAHCNSAQFINCFYDSEDEFPLLLLSNCEINDLINWNTLSVIRVVECDDIFTFDLVKVITFYDQSFKWGSSIVYDEKNNCFLSISNSNGPYNCFEDNSNLILCFDGIDNWINGMNESRYNGILIYSFPSHFVFQSIGIYNNYLFIGAQINVDSNDYWYVNSGICGTAIMLLNYNDNIIKIININKSEIEGVCFYNGEFYIQTHLSISNKICDVCLCISKFKYFYN